MSIDPAGKKSNAAEFFAAVKPLFEAAQKGKTSEKLSSATVGKDGSVHVSFEMHLDLIGKNGTTKVHEVGVDTWKRVNGKWVFGKTVDKAFTVETPKAK